MPGSLVDVATAAGQAGWRGFGVASLGPAFAALGLSFLLTILLGPATVAWLRRRCREPICGDSPRLNRMSRHKQSTPTMGGLFPLAALLATLSLVGDWHSPCLGAAVFLIVGLTALGTIDDLTKLRTRRRGLSAGVKLIGQSLVALAAAAWLSAAGPTSSGAGLVYVPLIGCCVDWGAWTTLLGALVIVASSNAVNLTDGLDGLAGGCLVYALAGLAVVACCGTAPPWTAALNLPEAPGAADALLITAATLGAVLGFLRFNRHPARVFMGDTGALPLGGLLGLLALMTRQELLLILLGGVFVVEAASVIVQVSWFRLTRRRVLRCAPLHHHFQFLGWAEPRIVARFTAASAACACLALVVFFLPAVLAPSSGPRHTAAGRTRQTPPWQPSAAQSAFDPASIPQSTKSNCHDDTERSTPIRIRASYSADTARGILRRRYRRTSVPRDRPGAATGRDGC